jgi:hypothetical protein
MRPRITRPARTLAAALFVVGLLGCAAPAPDAAARSGPLPAELVARNLGVETLAAPAVLDSLLAAEQDLPTAARCGLWARRFLAWGGAGYRFGLADGGYVAEGRLVPGATQDCVSLVYRITELARATNARDALAVAVATRFAGADLAGVVQPDGRVDYDHPAHLDFALDQVRSGHWGGDVTSRLTGARPDSLPGAGARDGRYARVPQDALRDEELQDGDLAWLVLARDDPAAARLRREFGIVIGHVGVIVVEDGVRWLVHAASRPLSGYYDTAGIVRVPLRTYLDRVERYDGVIVTRFGAD